MNEARRRIVLATDSPAPSGVGEHMLTLAAGFATEDDVIVAAPAGTGLLERAVSRGFGVKAIDPGDGEALLRWLERHGPALVHVHAGIGWEGHDLSHAGRVAGAGVIRTEHLPYLLTDPGQQEQHVAGLTYVDRLICVSAAVAESHRSSGVTQPDIAVIANGVAPSPPGRPRDVLRAEWGFADAPVLLMAARFAPQKDHALVLDALPAVLAMRPDVIVLLAGEGPLLVEIARAVARRGLAGAVRMLGPRGDVPDLMAAADLLLLPSRFEGLSLVALEAMAAGLPIVASDVPANAEAIEPGKTGWLAPAGDPAALAATILDALGDRDRLADVAAAALLHQRARFDARRMIDETRAVYAAVARKPEGASVRKTRIGFIGAGGIAHRHFGVLEGFDDVEIVAVSDVDMARATEAAARFGARAFADAGEMLDAVEVDAVYICVPPFAHGAPERAAMARNLPFFVEKPVALDMETADAIAAEVASAGLVTAVGYHWRYLDTVDEVKRLLAGNPARLLSGYWLDATPPPVWWWHEDKSGGQIVEQTTHLLDLARYLVGDVTRAYGLAGHTARAAFPGLDVPTVSSASLLFESGAIANFASTCLLNWNHRVALHLFGEGLAIELTDHDLMIDVGRGRPVRQAEGDPVWREDRDFINAVRGGENRIRCPYADAIEAHRLALAVTHSARTGIPVTFALAQPELAYV